MKRGISPIIAAVLLVIIAVAAGVMIWMWLSGYAQKNPTIQPALNERFRIDTVAVDVNAPDYDNNNNDVVANVTNIGDATVQIKAFYIIDTITGNVVCVNDTVKGVILRPGQVGTVWIGNCSTGQNLTSGHIYTAKVVSSSGTEAVYTFTAP